MAAIHQLVAGFSRGDAISNEALVLRRIFRAWGYRSEIFSEARRILPDLRAEIKDIAECIAASRPEDLVLLHLSTGSEVNEIFRTLPGRKAILYHNITPAEYFRSIQARIAAELARGRDQARALAGVATVVLADSQYNADELTAWGYAGAAVFPLALDFSALRSAPDRATVQKYADGLVNVLFVGRCAPNKKIEDVLVAFAHYQKFVEPRSRLIHAGSFTGLERYYHLLRSRVRDLQLQDVVWAGSVPQSKLNAFYRSAHVFLCLSGREGFCIPLIESMVHDVPVVAYAAAAVPETLGGAGILFHEKHYPLVAEAMGRVARPGPLRDAVLAAQRERLARFMGRDIEAELKHHLAPLLG